MINRTRGMWLLLTVALVGLALAVPLVSAHGDEPAPDTETHDEVDATHETWMGEHMTEHMGTGTDEHASHNGQTTEEMPHDRIDANHTATGMGAGHGC